MRLSSTVLGAAIALASLAWAGDVPRFFGLVLYTEQYLALLLGLGLCLAYLRFSVRGRPHVRVPWYDVIAAVFGLAAGLYVAVAYPNLVDELGYRPLYLVVLGVILLILSTEGLRRVIGPPLTIVVVIFFAYALFGHLVPGQLSGRPVELSRLLVYLSLDTNALLGTPLIVATTVVIPFIFIGQILSRTGGAAFFTDVSMALMGRFRGGSAKICIVASALFGMISGSAVSNVATVGVLTIPLMMKGGYVPRVAAAIEAAGSTGGQLMPPVMGAAAFLMAEFLRIPYSEVITAALIPALLYYGSLFIQADLIAARYGLAPVEADKVPNLRNVLRTGWHFPIPFAALVVAMFNFNRTPQEAALWAAGLLIALGLLFGYQGKRASLGSLLACLWETGLSVVELILICAAAGIVIGVLGISGLGSGLPQVLAQIGHDNLHLLLVLAAVIALILGMGMPTVGVYVLVATVVAPALIKLGVAPISAHMFVMYFGMISMITPPVALAAFTAASIARTEPMRTGVEAVRFAWPAFLVPFLFIASPTLVMVGEPIRIAIDAITALAGVWFGAAAIVGYFLTALGPVQRAVYALVALSLLMPTSAFAGAGWLNAAGGVAGFAIIAWEFTFRERRRRLA